ncbi:MAG: ATP-binding protein [Actinobacteria bacterium]|nr:ATP-binding protein [Actinomycetota bacterium]
MKADISYYIIDEIQRMPSLFPLLRALVDQKRAGGRFLILGSASPALIKQASESLAGRIIYHELTPFTMEETGYDSIQKLWLRGGYPESYLAHFNTKKRLIKSPKVFIRDSGLLHALLGIRTFEDLQGHPGLGSSWEGFIVEQIIGLIPKNWRAFFYRTSAGAEIDLLLLDAGNRPVAVEVKYSASPKVSKGFWIACDDLSCGKGFVVYPGEESYPIGNNVFTLPAKDLRAVIEGV